MGQPLPTLVGTRIRSRSVVYGKPPGGPVTQPEVQAVTTKSHFLCSVSVNFAEMASSAK